MSNTPDPRTTGSAEPREGDFVFDGIKAMIAGALVLADRSQDDATIRFRASLEAREIAVRVRGKKPANAAIDRWDLHLMMQMATRRVQELATGKNAAQVHSEDVDAALLAIGAAAGQLHVRLESKEGRSFTMSVGGPEELQDQFLRTMDVIELRRKLYSVIPPPSLGPSLSELLG